MEASLFKVRTGELFLQRSGDIGKIDEFQRTEHICRADRFVLFLMRDVLSSAWCLSSASARIQVKEAKRKFNKSRLKGKDAKRVNDFYPIGNRAEWIC